MRFGQMLVYTTSGRRTGRYEDANPFDMVVAAARVAEEVGFDSLWYPDHFMFEEEDGDPEVEVLECFTMLAGIAARTERIRFGEYVAGAPYRNPGLMAKMYTTLDIIGHGRSIIGIGAAWHREEFQAYGWPFLPPRERIERLEDYIQIITRMLTEPRASYEGTHLSIEDTINYPRPVQQPRPPIMIGGGGERYTLRLVARYADMYNTWGGDPARVRHKFEVLRQHCQEIGRPYDEITRSNHVTMLIARDERELETKKQRYTWFRSEPPLIGTPEAIINGIKEYAAAGSQYLIFDLVDWHDPESTYLFAEKVMPAVRDL